MLEVGTKFNEEKKLWEGPEVKPLFNPSVSLGQVIIRMLSMHGPKVAQISDDFGVQTTFNEILIKTIRAAQNLNIPSKSVCGFFACNNPDLAPILFASICLGCSVSALDPTFGKTELKSIISITKPNVYFCDVNLYDLLHSVLNELNIAATIFTFTGQRGKSMPIEILFAETNIESDFLPMELDGEKETAVIAASYGICGTLEGICLSHALLLDKTTRLSSIVSSGDVLFAFSSIYWLSGIANLLKATYYGATRIITTRSYSSEYLLELIEKYKITHVFASLQQITSALQHIKIESIDLSSVKSVAISSRKVSQVDYAAICNRFKNAVPYNMFGLCELGGAISVSRGSQLTLNSYGMLMNGIKVKIVDENGNRLVVGERGRIYVSSDYYFNGYYGKDGNDAIIDKENFMKTGNIGYFDVDGYLHILGREIDMIPYDNCQIAPEEIETVLYEHSAIKSACVVSLNNLLTALIVRNANASISEDEVCTLISEISVHKYKLRGGVFFVSELPTTHSGKIIRRLAKEIAEKEFKSRNNMLKNERVP